MPMSCTVFDCSDPAAPVPAASFGLDAAGAGFLVYGRLYIGKPGAFDLDPIRLKLGDKVLPVPRRLDGSYGVLSDAGPNAWGMKLAASILTRARRPLPSNPVEWLLSSWHYGSGCLGFSRHHTEAPNLGVAAGRVDELSGKLVHAIGRLAVKDDVELTDADMRLLAPGSSLGGVRPKTVVMHDGVEHIAKFARPEDVFDVPAVEFATMSLAHAAGIHTPGFELINIGGRSVFLIERFDRTEDGHRKHYLSAHSLLDPAALSADGREYKTRFSYAGIAETMRPILTRGQHDSHQLFRRMVFNIFVGNVDDHLRNHAFIMDAPGRYDLAPAFDILPHPSAATHPQSIGVGAAGAASTSANALSQCGRFLLKRDEANEIIEAVRDVVAGWRLAYSHAGVGARDLAILDTCIAPLR
jgi:serine/threonine-protein kinase HipA